MDAEREALFCFPRIRASVPLLFKAHSLLRVRVREGETVAKQADGATVVRAVFSVSKQGVAAVRELYADLMGSSGVQANFDQAIAAVFGGLDATENLIVQNRLFYPLSLALHHKGFVAVAIVKEQVGQSCAGSL